MGFGPNTWALANTGPSAWPRGSLWPLSGRRASRGGLCTGIPDSQRGGPEDHRAGAGQGQGSSSLLGPEYVASSPPRPGVLRSSLAPQSRARDEKQSLGRVYGFLPPNCQSSFTISGDKVRPPRPPAGAGAPCRLWGRTVLTDGPSQAMEKLGASLSSGHVLVNGTRKQVLLVGAPTRGRSRTARLGCFPVRWLPEPVLWGERCDIWSQTDLTADISFSHNLGVMRTSWGRLLNLLEH